MNDQEEYIEAYLNDGLSDAERKLFELRYKQDKDFAKEVDFYTISGKAVRQRLLEEKRQQWIKYDLSRKNFKLVHFNNWIPYAAAACILILVTLFLLNPSSTPQHLATKYFNEHLIQVSQTMNASKDSLQKGIAAYNNKDYATALLLFENIHRSYPEQADPIKYMGNVYLATKDYDNALKYFDQLTLMKGKYSNPGPFLKAVALLMRNKQDDKSAAKLLLQQVVNKKEEGSRVAEEWLKKW